MAREPSWEVSVGVLRSVWAVWLHGQDFVNSMSWCVVNALLLCSKICPANKNSILTLNPFFMLALFRNLSEIRVLFNGVLQRVLRISLDLPQRIILSPKLLRGIVS